MRQVCFSSHPPLHSAHELASLFIRGFFAVLVHHFLISWNRMSSAPSLHNIRKWPWKQFFWIVSTKLFIWTHLHPVSFIVLKVSILQMTLKCLLLSGLPSWLICISFFKELTLVLIHTIQVASFIYVFTASHDIYKRTIWVAVQNLLKQAFKTNRL